MFVTFICLFLLIFYFQVQATARNIIDSLEGDLDSEQTSAAVTSPMTSPPTRGSTPADKAADKWSMAFCEFYRDE